MLGPSSLSSMSRRTYKGWTRGAFLAMYILGVGGALLRGAHAETLKPVQHVSSYIQGVDAGSVLRNIHIRGGSGPSAGCAC